MPGSLLEGKRNDLLICVSVVNKTTVAPQRELGEHP